MNIALILAACVHVCLCQFSETANFPQIQTGVKTGEHKAVLTPVGIATTMTRTQSQSFFVTFSSAPQVAIGLLTFEVYTQSSNLGYTVQVSSITTTGFTSIVTALTDNTINELKYTYLGLANDKSFGYLHQTDFTGFASTSATSSSAVHTKTLTTALTFDSTRMYKISAFLKDFSLNKLNNDFSIKASASAIFGTSNIEMKVQSNCTVVNMSMFVFWIDKTLLESDQRYFIDLGQVVGENNSTKYYNFGFPITIINYYNFMSGGTWLAFNTTNETTFSLRFNSYPLYTLRQYKYAYANFLHWRQRVCPTSTYLYLEDQLKCYQSCPDRYANNTAQKYCVSCPYSCLNCTYDSACTGCNLTGTHRYLDNSKCLCADKYYDVSNVQECSECHYTCATCQINSTNCLTCHSTRVWNSTTHTCLCKLRSYDTGTSNQVCSPCHYTCLTCSSNTNSSCLTCDETKFRTKVLNSCLCQNGYEQNTTASNIELCVIVPNLTCSLNCYTCNGTSAHCTGCDPNKKRALSSAKKCQCKSGYTSNSDFNACTQICGDGKVYDQNQCDDGNTASGDGCSSTCTIEADFDCNSTVTTQPSICVYRLPYTIILKSINKRPTQNLMDIEFEIKPPPPAGSKASLSNLPLIILSQNIDAGTLKLVTQYVESIPMGSLARLSLSSIPNSIDFQVKSDNGLALNYYSTSNYGAYNAQVALVWLYVALVWLGILVFLTLYHSSILPLTQFIMSVGLTWVGVGTFTRYFLYYQPLLNLKYIFGYNAVISGQDGMFAFVNYGFILCIAPIILFFIIFSMKRLHRHLVMDQFGKKFLLGQVTFAFLCFNCILVVYGLASEELTKTRSTPLSIASICIGIIYLLLVLAGSVYFILRPQSFFYLKDPMFTPKGPRYFIGVMVWSKLLTVLAYTLFSFNHQSSPYPPLIVAVMSVINIVITVFVRPYENNIRVILNEIATVVIFLAFFLMLEVSTAEWTGFAILMILYVQMIINYAMIGNNWYKQRMGQYEDEEEETYSADKQSKDQELRESARDSAKKVYNIDMDFDPRAATTELKKPQIVDDIESNLSGNRIETAKRYESIPYGNNSRQNPPYPEQFSSIRKRMFMPQAEEHAN